ncbi:MAG TPA: hypothetical protein VHD83_23875 [Puia sp.]|nr:hypothetical protein [Puia sp.]
MTFKSFGFLLASFFALSASGQDTAWKSASITKDVFVDMPGPETTLDTAQVQAVNAALNGYVFQIKYIKPKYEVKNGDALIQAYDGFLNGYLKTGVKAYTNTVSDTSLKGTIGEWIHSRYSKDSFFIDMYSYVVLVNSHFYMITLAASHPINANDPMLNRFFASLRFPTWPIREHSGDFPLQARSYRNGQHIGRWVNRYFPYSLGAVIVALVVVLLYRRGRRKKI